jgi:hypothetical protein
VGHQPRRLSPQRNDPAHHCVCQPVNDVGEPCAGEPHARFDAAAGGAPAPVGPARAARPWPPPADPTGCRRKLRRPRRKPRFEVRTSRAATA